MGLQRLELSRKLCDVLLESIDETLTGLLSRKVADALYAHLQAAHSISRDEVPYRLETFCSAFDSIFGSSHKTICRAIARKFYVKLGLTFFDNPSRTLIEYVEEAKMKLGEGEAQL
jgi:hypothetical protein